MAEKKFIDLVGLGHFHDQLVEKLAANSATSYVVNYAKSATNDGGGNNIATTYLTSANAALTYLPLGTTLAGLKLKDTITAAQLAEALPLVASVTGDGVTTNGQAVTINLSNYATKDMIATVLRFKGVKANLAEIEAVVNPSVGDLYIAQDSSAEYVYIEKAEGSFAWEPVGSLASVDLSGYYTKSEIDVALAPLAKTADVNNAISTAQTTLQGNIDTVAGRVKVLEDADFGKQITDAQTSLQGEINKKLDATAIDAYSTTEEMNGAIAAAKDEVQGKIDLVNDEIDAMDLPEVKNAAGFISAVSQSDGKVSASATAFDTTVTAESTIAPTSAAVVTYVGGQIEAYDETFVAVTNGEIDTIFND